jgi:hypothetical protein
MHQVRLLSITCSNCPCVLWAQYFPHGLVNLPHKACSMMEGFSSKVGIRQYCKSWDVRENQSERASFSTRQPQHRREVGGKLVGKSRPKGQMDDKTRQRTAVQMLGRLLRRGKRVFREAGYNGIEQYCLDGFLLGGSAQA